jgi:hypothetical protein
MPGGKRLDAASSLIQYSLHAYYRLHGSWPGSWKEVVDSGLFTGTLTTPAGQVTDPDDKRLDFVNDLYYDPTVQDGNVLVLAQIGSASHPLQYIWMTPCATYDYRLQDAASNDSSGCYSAYLKDSKRQQQFAQLFLLSRGTDLFVMVKNRLPDSITDLVNSGLCSFSTMPLNPYTGLPYRCDGSANDIIYKKMDESDGKSAYLLRHILADGSMPSCAISY